MELKKRFDWRKLFTIIYVTAFAVYLVVGLQPAEAREYEIVGRLEVPAIGLESGVTELELVEHKLDTPDAIVGSFSRAEGKTLLIGHSSTVFAELDEVVVGDEVVYDGNIYTVVKVEVLEKGEIDMSEILAGAEEETVIIMTCAGEMLPGHDATHRLIVTAVAE